MCPDDKLLSACVDGEVPSPWKERLERHLAECPECSGKYDSYAALREKLHSNVTPAESAALALAMERIAAKLPLDGRPAAAGRRPASVARPRPIWTRALSIPMPLAAAALVAIVFLAGLATGFFGFFPANARTLAATQKILAAQTSSLDELVRYLDAQNSSQAVTFRLPSEASFSVPGNPVLMTTSSGSVTTMTVPADGGGAQ